MNVNSSYNCVKIAYTRFQKRTYRWYDQLLSATAHTPHQATPLTTIALLLHNNCRHQYTPGAK